MVNLPGDDCMAEDLHTTDFFGWTAQQAALPRAGKVNEIISMPVPAQQKKQDEQKRPFQKSVLGHLNRHLITKVWPE